MLVACGRELRDTFDGPEELDGSPEFREAFKSAYIGNGGNSSNVPSYWARIKYQYAWPGTGRASGKYYKQEGDAVVLDTARNVSVTPPPGAKARAPKFLALTPTLNVVQAPPTSSRELQPCRTTTAVEQPLVRKR